MSKDEYTVNQLADLAELTIKDTQMENAPPKPITQLLDEYSAESSKSNEKFKFLIYFTFSLLDNVIANFKLPKEYSESPFLIDTALVHLAYSKISKHPDGPSLLCGAMSLLLDKILQKGHVEKKDLGVYVVALMNPYLMQPEYQSVILPRILTLLVSLPKTDRIQLQFIIKDSCHNTRKDLFENVEIDQKYSDTIRDNLMLISKESSFVFLQLVNVIQQFITFRVLTIDDDISVYEDEQIVNAVLSLDILYILNELAYFVPYYEFYNEAIESSLEMKDDYPKWKEKEGFSFCHYPFVLSTTAKAEVLKLESVIHMRHELQDSFFRALFIGVNSPYLQIEVRRNFVIRDTLFQLEGKEPHDLRKQLRVSFVGEEGIDEGGVQKEFFQIIVKDMFNPEHGMFIVNEDSRLYWFINDQQEDKQTLQEYNLIGRLLGLAIYNGVILNIQFPLALYKKLLGYPVVLSDVKQFDPMLGKGLQQLLGFSQEELELVGKNFQITYQTPNEKISFDLKEDGQNIAVDLSNIREFITLYIDFIFNKSISKQYAAFKEGFDQVMAGSCLPIFRPEELCELICGSPDYDFYELEKVTTYDGYTSDDRVIKDFWEIVHAMGDEEKKRLLFFTTGSDRIPVGGLGKLQFIIAKNGGDSDRLPTSHTCYNVLLLSAYSSKEKLADRLATALNNSNCGFFLN